MPGAPQEQRGSTELSRSGGPRLTSSPTPPNGLSPQLSQNLDGIDPGADPFFAGHELYRALRGSQGDDPLTDELLWDGDFLTSQREFIQKKQEEQLLERLERRMGEQQHHLQQMFCGLHRLLTCINCL